MTDGKPTAAIGWAIKGGLLAGTFDILFAIGFWAAKGVPAIRILQSVAAGWLGKEAATQGGIGTAALGLVSHYGLALAMAVAYFVVASRARALVRNALPFGIAYGLFLYLFMQWVVLPLSAAGASPIQFNAWLVGSLLAHALLVGVPIAYFARRGLSGSWRAI